MKADTSSPGGTIILKASVIIMGLSGIMAQIILLRELLIVSFGNELIIGVVLSNWLLFEGAGSWLFGRLKLTERKVLAAYLIVQVAFALVLPAAIVATRFAKEIAGIHAAGGLGFIPVILVSLIVLFPVSFLHGSLFTLNCRLACRLFTRDAGSISKVYIVELIGTTIGGILVYLLIVKDVPALHTAFGLSLFNIIVLIPLFAEFKLCSKGVLKTCVIILGSPIIILLMIIVLFESVGNLNRMSIERQWKGKKLLHYQNSIYGNLAVTEDAEQRTFFIDGQPIIISPDTDIAYAETIVHLAMAVTGNPEDILIIGGGAGGILNEVLKHPVERIDYTELDPLLIELVEKYPTDLTTHELSHPAVNIIHKDGRMYAEATDLLYDVIIIGIESANDLQTNRMFTTEFFLTLSGLIRGDGVLALMKPGSFSYLSEELRQINQITENSLSQAFEDVFILPCENNLFLASNANLKERMDPYKIYEQLTSHDIYTKMLSLGYLEYQFRPYRREWYLEQTEGVTSQLNLDFTPNLLFWSMSYWNSIVAPASHNLFRFISRLDFRKLFGFFVVLCLTALLVVYFLQTKKVMHPTSILPMIIFSTGLSGMIFDLAIIYSFQIIYGYVFSWVGLLFVAFMVGAAMGATWSKGSLATKRYKAGSAGSRQVLDKDKAENVRKSVEMNINMRFSQPFSQRLVKRLILLEFFIVVFSLLILQIGLGALKPFLNIHPLLFLILPLIAGVLTGSQFPIATHIYHLGTDRYEKSAGVFYSADLFGGFFGGIVGGVILLPFVGLANTMLFVLTLKIFSFCSLLLCLKASRKVL